MYIIQPQLRSTSEIRYHSDLAPGQRFVFAGRVVDPICRLYIVGRKVEQVPADQPEWLDDHRHNCPTFYVLIGRNRDLTGLAAEIVIEGRSFVAESPSAIMLPKGFLHHHRLMRGGGWSFHVNVRADYEESLLDDGGNGAPRDVEVRVDRLYRGAELFSPSALSWEVEDGAVSRGSGDSISKLWKFIDPREFDSPGVRLHALHTSEHARGRWSEALHSHPGDEVTILLSHEAEPLEVEATSGTETAIARSPISVYHPAGVPHRCRHVGGDGLVLKFLRLSSHD